MGTTRASDHSGMDSVHAIGSGTYAMQVYARAGREDQSSEFPEPAAALDALNDKDPAKAQQAVQHLIGHVNAECFISLLKILDPLPDDERDRAEYRRRYQQLERVLETPPIPRDPPPVTRSQDPLW